MSASTNSFGTRPVVLCRDHIAHDMIADVDAWTPKHFDDSLAHPAVVAAASFGISWSLPSVFSEPGAGCLYTWPRTWTGCDVARQ